MLRCSFGWDDYEPARGQYDFAWLEQFVALAAQYGIKLRPYIGYTAPWAADGGSGDGTYWNHPPANLRDWYNFVYNLARALSDHPNVLSYEIYNEENDAFWWDGTMAQYNAVLQQGAAAVRAADPDAQVILRGFVFPDYEWISGICSAGNAPMVCGLVVHGRRPAIEPRECRRRSPVFSFPPGNHRPGLVAGLLHWSYSDRKASVTSAAPMMMSTWALQARACHSGAPPGHS